MNRIGITMGDPAGVGPEVILRALADPEVNGSIRARVYGSPSVFDRLATLLGLDLELDLVPCSELQAENVRPGCYSAAVGQAQVACLDEAASDLAAGRIDALVTGPLNKRALLEAGGAGPGHTEWLAHRFAIDHPVMMLAGPRLRVVVATTHLALRNVAASLNRAQLETTIQVAHEQLQRFFVPSGPRLALAALNPHGEEGGQPGREEQELLIPLVSELRQQGLDIQGPIAGDTVYALASQGRFDCVISLYHDQGLAALKTLHFSDSVNITLGLGLVRTSPDHGPAYDIAWRGEADPASMKAAILTADQMVHTWRKDI